MSSRKINLTLQALNGFFILSGIMFFIGAATSFRVSQQFINRLDAQILISFVSGLFTALFFLDIQKSNILKSLEGFKIVKAEIDNYPRLDQDSLNAYTQKSESLGFYFLGDISTQQGETSHGIARILWHPEHNCFAEIAQNFSIDPIRDTKIYFTFGSLLETPWLLATSNLENGMKNGFIYMMRRPKSLWQNYVDYGVEQTEDLLGKHLELRQAICSTLNLQVQTNLNLESYTHHEEDEGLQRHAVLEKKNILVGLVEAYLFELNPKTEWLGDYAKFAKRNKNRG